MKQEEFQAIRDWYTEWVRVPTYLASVSLAFLAFSFTDLLPKAKLPEQVDALIWLKFGWGALSIGAVFSTMGLICAYAAFDLGARLYLGGLLRDLGMTVPKPRTGAVSRWGKLSFRASIISLGALLSGALSLTLYAFMVT